MYIVAIAWMYVAVLMAATQDTILAGVGTLVFYGIIPCAVLMYVIMAPTRARRKKALNKALEAQQTSHNASHTASHNVSASSAASSVTPTSQTDP